MITKAIELKKIVGIIYQVVAYAMYTFLILRHVSGDCAFSIWECLRPENVTNIYHFCYNLQLNLMFYYIKVAFLICILQCALMSKVQVLALYTKYINTPCSYKGQINFLFGECKL